MVLGHSFRCSVAVGLYAGDEGEGVVVDGRWSSVV